MSYWLNEQKERQNIGFYDTLPLEIVDVAIIGGGITGASCAYHIAKRGNKTCVLLERGGISAGATGCNGGFICPGTSEKFSASVDRYGLEATKTIFNYTVACTEAIKEFLKDSNIECELRFNGSAMLAFTDDELTELKESYVFLRASGVEVEWWDKDTCVQKTKSNSFQGGIFKPMAGNLWAAKVVYGIVEEALKLGVNIQTNTEVLAVENNNIAKTNDDRSCDTAPAISDVITIRTSKGVLRARNVVYCANAWSRELLPCLENIIIPVRNQVFQIGVLVICIINL